MERILVAVDRSPCAHEVLTAGIDLARRTGAKIWLLRAVPLQAELPVTAFATPPTLYVEGSLLTARRDLAELSALVPPELLGGMSTQLGSAWDAICSAARAHDVDVIVIGSHAYGLLDRIVGTTAAKVVNHADRPVLVVRPRLAA
jgi:nucleotide-binding universal stress UspA family protein